MRRVILLLILVVGGWALLRPIGGIAGASFRLQVPSAIHGGVETLLVLGLDRRGDEIARPDTIFLARYSASGESPRLLWIPRDLLVAIPSRGEDRINTAYVWGDLDARDGAGLTRRLIEQYFGVRIDRVVVVDFACFQAAIDAAGGVTVDVPGEIVDPAYPSGSGGTEVLLFEPGRQTLTGARALQYARTRAGDSDFGRIRRQQDIVAALSARVKDPVLGLKIADAVLRGCPGVGTDMSALDLAMLAASSVAARAPVVRAVDESMVTPAQLPSGALVLLPDWDQIHSLVRDLFGPGPRGQSAAIVR